MVTALLDEVYRATGVDYRGWRPDLMAETLAACAVAEGLAPGDMTALCGRLLDDRGCFERLVLSLATRPAPLLGDRDFCLVLRRELVPWLRTYPSVRVWHAGCGTGEDVYATALVLHEEGLLSRCHIYATDQSELLVERARSGVFAGDLDRLESDYWQGGGRVRPDEYVRADGRVLEVRPLLRRQVVFAVHDFASDASFNEFHLIICRGLMSRFGPPLAARARAVLGESLCRFGFLALGPGQSPGAGDPAFEVVRADLGLYRRIG